MGFLEMDRLMGAVVGLPIVDWDRSDTVYP